MEKKTNKQTNKKTLCLQADGPSKQGRSVGPIFSFVFLVAKMTIKHKNFEKIRNFLQKNLGKIFWLTFQKFAANMFKIKEKK